jgi:hypothetical protein
MYAHEYVVARRVRTDQVWDAGVGACGGIRGRSAREWRSLDVDHHDDVEPTERGQHNIITEEDCRVGGAARSGGGIFLRISRRRKTARHGGFE